MILPSRATRPQFKYCSDWLFMVAVTAYACNRWMPKTSALDHNWFVSGYLNDLLLVPCILPPVLRVRRWLGARTNDLAPSVREVVGFVALWSVAFEVVIPRIHCSLPRETADIRDVVAYALGGAISWLIWTRRTGSRSWTSPARFRDNAD